MAIGVLAVLCGIATAIVEVLDLRGRLALIPYGVALGVLLAWGIGVNAVDALRRRRRP